MGVKNLTTYINKNIKLERQKWRVNKSYYYSLKRLNSSKINRFYQTNKGKKDDDEPGNINIIVDSRSFCYFLGRQMNWFIYDNIRFLKFLRKYVLLLLSIENLNKIIFIFDGVVEIRKRIKRKSRQEERIKNIKKFYNKIQTKNYKNGALLRPEVNLCASQLLLNTFIQYLLNIEKLFPNKIEIVSSVSKESDIYIAELANNINGYVISNDSDFYVYNIPGFIHLDSLKFPNFVNKNIYIEYELYTSDLLIDHLCISKEILPIFATLCSNDYLIVNNFQKFLDQVNHYHVTQESTFHIKNEYFKKLVNFILDICDDLKIKFNNENTDEFRQHQQMLIIEEIIKRKDKEINDDVEEEFKDNLIFSVNEFNLLNIKEYNIDPNLVSSEIVESYYSNNITTKLLKVIIDKRFRCNIYLENIDKVCCWNVTDDIRKQLYKLLISRNNLGLVHDSRLKESDIEIPQKYTITELIRDNTRFVERKVNILINNQFPETPEEQFTRYLEIFYRMINTIKNL
ncbi:hypothetical protein BCR36DRAFT_106603 [Piromyces finnis]|uniref:Uncharacterized protein n=1 Tax=Piromyces finnis TaxID=1754191 RepID=A0A1Y1V2N9_9FUNG|nr:hypothetical protein BCR36DRAFT_106603 [Piromyces finnis]|eukprot:ORX45954.1 hypothetical protein BCR36DRAFT_106603 [Piromyces finnis]